MKKVTVALITFFMIFGYAKGVQALILPQVTMEEMIVKADTIVSGRSDHFHIHPDLEGNVLYAIITFKVEEYLKNNLQKEEIILMQVAREKGPDGKLVAGPLALKIDEEVVLFLTEEDNLGFRHVLGLSQGKYTVSQDRKGERQLLQHLKDVRFFDKVTGQISDPKEIQVKLTYEEFKAIIRLVTSRIKARKEIFTVLPENHSF